MRALIPAAALLVSAAVWAAAAPAEAQGTACTAHGCAEGCTCGDQACYARQCGGGGDDPGSSAEAQAQAAAAREADFQRRYEQARREGVVRQAESARRANDRGIEAARKKNWRLAISQFEAGLLLDPENAELARNLSDARAREQHELRGRELGLGPVVPASAPAVTIADSIPVELTPSVPGASGYIADVRSWMAGQASQAVGEGIEQIDVTTPWGMFVRVQLNVAKVAREVPDWIMQAARGEMSLDEASRLPMKAAAMILNVGTGPGKYAQRLVEVRSGTVVALEAAEERMTEIVENGITSLASKAGLPEMVASKALALGKERADRIWRWVRGAGDGK